MQEDFAPVSIEDCKSGESFTNYSNGSSILTATHMMPWDPRPNLRGKDAPEISLRLVQDVDISAFGQSKSWVLAFARDGRFLAMGSVRLNIGERGSSTSGPITVGQVTPIEDLPRAWRADYVFRLG